MHPKKDSVCSARISEMGLLVGFKLRLARSTVLGSRRPGPPTPALGRRAGGYKWFSLSLSLSYIITRVAPHCVNTLRILHAAYDATIETCPLVNTPSVR